MKKLIITALSTIVVATTAMGLTACGKEYKYDFMVDGQVYKSIVLNEEFAKPADPTKTGYTFAGWYLNDVEYTDFTVELEADVQLVAKWTVNQYSISFDANGAGTIDTITQDFDTAVSAPTTPTKTGYDFAGWFEANSNTAYNFNKIEARDVALTAKWTIKKYSINFNSDGGTAVDTITQDYQSSVTAPTAPTKEGYTFAGWFEEGSSAAYVFNVIEARTVELKAKWTINAYSIIFNSDGGSSVDTITQDFGTTVSAPAVPTKVGYTFVGWFEEGSATAYEFNTIEARIVELKAKWTINAYSIEFNSDGGSLVATITQDYQSSVTAPVDPTKEGYTFAGWFEEGSATAYEFNTIEARTVELKAKWTINQYTINFNSDGGTAVAPITQDYATSVSAPTAPTKEHYDFAGWFEAGSATAYNFNTIEARNVDLIAKWTIKKYSITFDSDGGSLVDTITQDYNTAVAAPTIPTKQGYTFIGWFEDGEESAYEFAKIEGRDVSLVAKWSKNETAFFALYKPNADYTNKEQNTSDLSVNLKGENYTIEASTFANKLAGDVVQVILKDGQNKDVVLDVTVVTLIITKAEEIVNLQHFSKAYYFDRDKDGVKESISAYGEFDVFVLANDIDMINARQTKYDCAGVFGVANSGYENWGFMGTFDGNGHTLYNLNSRLFHFAGRRAHVKNLGITTTITSGNILANRYIGKIENCYFDVRVSEDVTGEISILSNYLNVSSERIPTISNVVVKVENYSGATVYALGKEIGGAYISNVQVLTSDYQKANPAYLNGIPNGTPVVSALDGMSSQDVDNFLKANDVNKDVWKVENGTLKFEYSRPEEIIIDSYFSKYVLNSNKNGRVQNTESLTLTYDNQNFSLEASTFAGIDIGEYKKVVLSESKERVLYANVKVVSSVLSTAEQVEKLFYLSDYYLFNSSGEYTPSNVHQYGMGDYFVMVNDIDMAGRTPVHSKYTGETTLGYYAWGFKGELDGNGYNLYNLEKPLFLKLSFTGEVKNLGIISRTANSNLIARQIFGKINNCYIDITVDGATGDVYPIAECVNNSNESGHNTRLNFINTIIKVNNLTDKTVYAYGKDCTNANFKNTYVFTNGAVATVAPITGPTVYKLDDKFSGNKENFNSSYWNTNGENLVWKGAILEEASEYYYGKNVLNEDKNGNTVNTKDLEILVNSQKVVFSAETLNSLDVKSKFAKYVKVGNIYKFVSITIANATIATAEDFANIVYIAGRNTTSANFNGYYVLVNDIDVSNVEIVYTKNPGVNETAWGFLGIFDGNGHTISGVNKELFVQVGKSAVIKNLKVKDISVASFLGRAGLYTLENCEFEYNAQGKTSMSLLAGDNEGASFITNCKFTVKNASAETTIYLVSRVTGVTNGNSNTDNRVVMTNVQVTTDGGTFKAIYDQTNTCDMTTGGTTTINKTFEPLA